LTTDSPMEPVSLLLEVRNPFNFKAGKNLTTDPSWVEQCGLVAGGNLALHLQEMAPGIFHKYCDVLLGKSLPSFGSVEYHTPYEALDFSSFFTFTLYNFFNKYHQDSDANTWTLVCWIPIFNPQTYFETDAILAKEGFDMMGGSGCHLLCLKIKSPYIPTRLLKEFPTRTNTSGLVSPARCLKKCLMLWLCISKQKLPLRLKQLAGSK
ncbi:hypothetical protein VP01_7385g1, partial [Puccinia sorghi]